MKLVGQRAFFLFFDPLKNISKKRILNENLCRRNEIWQKVLGLYKLSSANFYEFNLDEWNLISHISD